MPLRRRSRRSALAAVTLATLAPLFALASCARPPQPEVPPVTVARPGEPPPAPKATAALRKGAVDTLFGQEVSDPFRWLEDGESAETRAFTDEQNARTRKVLDALPGQAGLKARIRELLEVGVVSPPVRTLGEGGARYFHTKREGAQNQPTLWVRDGLKGADRPLVEASKLSEDGTVSLDWWYPARDGALVAWGKSESGSEESVLRVRDVKTGKDLDDAIPHTRHASVAWRPDGKAFFYTRYPEPGAVPAGDEKYFCKVYEHVLGQDPLRDPLVFERKDKTDVPQVSITPNGKWLVVRVHRGWDKSDLYVKDLSAKGAPSAGFAPVVEGKGALYDAIADDDRLWIHTNEDAPNFRLFSADWTKVDRASWKEVLKEGKDVLSEVATSKSEVLAAYLKDAATRLERFGKDGKSRGALALPTIGSAHPSATAESDEAFVGFTSYVVPSQVHRVDLGRGGLEAWDKVGGKLALADVTVERLTATSKDGTKVPMFVIAKKGTIKKDGKAPTVLYGYGGFNVNQTPGFSPRALAVVQSGGVWVSTILRGGGELGEAWHKAGMLEKKQNVFDDFFACAEELVKQKITSPDKLAAMGGSNGGLLVAAAVTQRPDLFRVGLSLVPLTDMVRYHRFRIAKLWVPEYGSPEDPAQFPFLYAYSPYHHVKEGTRYPAMLFTTAESDSRVDPMHARKMAARLQAVQADGERPILLRVETKAGHGAGKPVSKLTEELTDELGFLLHELGAAPAP